MLGAQRSNWSSIRSNRSKTLSENQATQNRRTCRNRKIFYDCILENATSCCSSEVLPGISEILPRCNRRHRWLRKGQQHQQQVSVEFGSSVDPWTHACQHLLSAGALIDLPKVSAHSARHCIRLALSSVPGRLRCSHFGRSPRQKTAMQLVMGEPS